MFILLDTAEDSQEIPINFLLDIHKSYYTSYLYVHHFMNVVTFDVTSLTHGLKIETPCRMEL